MSDIELVREILHQVLVAAQTVSKRFAPITCPEDFESSQAGQEKLDAICMQLIAIGESIKHLDKMTEGRLLPRYPQVEWKRVMGMRDVLSHHYFDLDAEIVYAACAKHIDVLAQTIQDMLAELDKR